MEDKDAIIAQQWRIINDQRLELAQLRYYVSQHNLLFEQPFEFLLWRLFVWPFVRRKMGF